MVASPPTVPATADQRIVMHGVAWSHYEAQLALRGDRSVPRVSYLEGAMELMSPSQDHERIKFYIGRLVEAYALAKGNRLHWLWELDAEECSQRSRG